MMGSNLVFLVDDDADYRYLVQQAFKFFLQKHRIRVFANGLDLVTALESSTPADASKPAAILLDIDMPQMDGFQTLISLKQNRQWKHVPVIMMTNRDHIEYREESLKLGAYTFLLKPVDMVAIKRDMTDICEMHGRFSALGGAGRTH